MKSPYINGSVIESLNKAYFPSKIKRGKKHNNKKKSSTPNVKVRNLQKEYIPQRLQYGYNQNTELNELEKLKNQREREEYEVMMNQKTNIEQLKKMLNDPSNYSIVHENEKEDEENDVQENATFSADTPEKEKEAYYLKQSILTNDNYNPIKVSLQTNEDLIDRGAVEINESEDDNDSEEDDENDDEGGDKENEEEKIVCDQIIPEKNEHEIPPNVILTNSDPIQKISK